MRKSLLSVLMLLVLVIGTNAQPISEQEALQKAQQFLQGKNIVSSQGHLRRAAKAHPYKHLYLFNAEDNGGFVIVSGDSRARDILAYSEEGNLDYDEMPDNMKWWLGLYDESIANIPADYEPVKETDLRRASKADVAPMMNYSWKQKSPFNYYCPQNCVAGCVPLAMAQIIAFWGYPSTLPALSGYTDTNGHSLQALSSRSVNYSNLSADDAAWLVRYAGQAIQANYGQTTTGAAQAAVPGALVNLFGFGSGAHSEYREAYSATAWDDMLYNELSNGRPFILSGQVNYDANNGHSFICHGYSQGYYAVNWGWGGIDNGYYSMSAMIGNGSDYSSMLTACIGISPSSISYKYNNVSLFQMEAIGSMQLYRNSSSQSFSNAQFKWTVRSSMWTTKDVLFALAIQKPDGNWNLLYEFKDPLSFSPSNLPSSTMTINIGSQYGDGTYKITLLYKLASESSNSWHTCAGLDWRYVKAVISGNTLTFTNYPEYDAPYPTGSYPDYPDPINPDNPDNPDNPNNPDIPDNPDVTGPTNDVAFEYPVVSKEYKGKDLGFVIDWTALSTSMFGYLKMNETEFFDNFWADCFDGDEEVPDADARYVSPYAFNYNEDGPSGHNNYDMLIYNFGDDIYGNNSKLPDPDEAEYMDPEYDYVAIAAFYPNYNGQGKHFMTFEIPQENLEYLLDDVTTPVTITRWIRFAAKYDDYGNSTAPFRFLWLKVQMQLSWSNDPDGIRTISADQTDAPVYNLSGQRLQVGKGNYKGIVIKNGKKILMK